MAIRQSGTGRARRGQAKERTLQHLIIEKGIKLIQRVAPRIAHASVSQFYDDWPILVGGGMNAGAAPLTNCCDRAPFLDTIMHAFSLLSMLWTCQE